MTDYQMAILVMNYLESLGIGACGTLDAICDENLERSYELITKNPQITKAEFLEKMGISDD